MSLSFPSISGINCPFYLKVAIINNNNKIYKIQKYIYT